MCHQQRKHFGFSFGGNYKMQKLPPETASEQKLRLTRHLFFMREKLLSATVPVCDPHCLNFKMITLIRATTIRNPSGTQ